jgi:photosynthetic reaction center cytochrome c subunit
MKPFMRLCSQIAALAAALVLAGCERPPVDSVQGGYRGTGMLQVYNPRTMAEQIPRNQPPPVQPPTTDDGPRAKDVFKNVQVLGDLSVGVFTRHMIAISAWVAPVESCNYCHVEGDLASDAKYQKVVARRMIQMTQAINTQWKPHVANTGVTCYTCHRGQHIPSEVWFTASPQDKKSDFIGNRNGQNTPAPTAGLTAMIEDPQSVYLKKAANVRVAAKTALPQGKGETIQHTEDTYALMMRLSQSLGVNCTYCHNTRSFGAWGESSPRRLTAWHGIRMVRELNTNYMEPLTGTFPPARRGPMGDVAKLDCGTCHQGAYKPVYGAQMAKDHPELLKVSMVSAAPAAAALPAPVAEPRRSVLYFEVGSAALKGEQAKGLEKLAAEMTGSAKLTATISGYHSAAGTLAQNQELAKQRAFAVRDAMRAAGIADSRVILAKPQQAEANVAGEDPTARRVEVTLR